MKISVITPTIRPKGLEIVKDCLSKQTFTDFEWLVEVGLGKEHDLNKAFNKMLKRAKGELIVFYQDYIQIPDDGLQKMWDEYQKDKSYLITAPVGKSDDYTNPKYDWRAFKFEDVGFQGWEIDWGACPKNILFEIGGFNEDLDEYWSFDNVDVAYRALKAGYKFKCIDNIAIAIDHDKLEKHPFREDFNPQNNNESLSKIDKGNYKKWI